MGTGPLFAASAERALLAIGDSALPFLQSTVMFRFKTPFIWDSEAPQYISKRLKPDGPQITCFPFFFFFLSYFTHTHTHRTFNWGFVPTRTHAFFSKFSKFIIGKSLSFLASSGSYERMENIWRQCQGTLSCHFHVVFPWCERVSSLGNFPFGPILCHPEGLGQPQVNPTSPGPCDGG